MLDSHLCCTLAVGLALLAGACSPDEPSDEVDAQERDGVWVITYAETPDFQMQALGSGPAALVDDCLQMGDAVVIWRDQHLTAVDEVIARVRDGESLDLQVGGGGLSVDEGSTVDDFPADVLEHCSPTAIWFSADGALEVEEVE